MQCLEVNGAVRPIYGSLGVKRLNIMSVCLYPCFSYPTCKTHLSWVASYCQPWPARLYHILLYYLKSGKYWRRKKIIERKMCCSFMYELCLKHF